MDNLTHSLVGAALGQAGLKRKTGLAMPALIIGANLPDIDATCFFWLEGTEHLGFRRGITHGPLALAILPLVLAGLLIAFDRWQARRGKRPESRLPVHPGWLAALCYLGAISHPALDWLNTYGIRLLEPFSSRWFYGDALFIIDPWLWVMLAAGVWLSLRRERLGAGAWTRPARAAISVGGGYVILNLLISDVAVSGVYDGPSTIVVRPVPVEFWRREVLWRDDGSVLRKVPIPERYGRWQFSLFDSSFSEHEDLGLTNMSDPRIAERAKGDPAAQAFLFWSRMPIAEIDGDRIALKDQRFLARGERSTFHVELKAR